MQKTKVLVIALFIYVCLQFSWWAYMLISLNNEVFTHKKELVRLQSDDNALRSAETLKLEEKLHSRWWMIAGEGLVFFSLLIFGIYKVLEAYNREYQLARSQKNFLLSITHEFKSPLAAVKLNLQTMQKHALNEEQKRNILLSSISETDRLNKLVEDALTAAQIETHTYSISHEKFNLSECIYNTMRSRLQSGMQRIDMEITDNIFIKGDCMALSSILINLVDNAIKYSNEVQHVLIELKRSDKHAVLRISDSGIGIPDSEKVKVFQKFYRIGNEDTRKTKGTGLGLYIVAQLVKMHEAEITVSNNKPQGSVFTITIPLV